jgi:serine-type D-Ala-D-Ala carboxypeptidase (penicillin-binding protein 5/6)
VDPLRRRRAVVAVVIAAGVASQAALVAGAGADTPPPTPVPPHGSLSPFPSVLDTPADPTERPSADAASVVLADLDTGEILFAKNPDRHRPIASVTKIMTALLVLERTSPSDIVTVAPEAVPPKDRRGLSELGLVAGERLTVRDLLYALLLQSANDAAVALADAVSGTEQRFVVAMNARARRLGMDETHFLSPNGLDDRGYSSARDLVILTRAAYASSPLFARISTTRFYEIPSPHGPPREIQNRDVMLWLYPGTIGGKTGYTAAAGQCVVAAAQRGGRRLVAVVLGSGSEPFSEAASLLDYGFGAFTRSTLVQPHEALSVDLPGGSVTAEATAGLTALVPTASVDRATRQVVLAKGVAFPPAPGERIGTLRVSTPSLVLGNVALVVTRVPPPAPPDEQGPWWRRAASSVARAASGVLHAVLG